MVIVCSFIDSPGGACIEDLSHHDDHGKRFERQCLDALTTARPLAKMLRNYAKYDEGKILLCQALDASRTFSYKPRWVHEAEKFR